MKQIPNLFTLLNLLFGCLAIIFTLQNGIMITVDTQGSELLYIPEKIWMASLFIGLAAIVDFLDGFLARLFKAHSGMGLQLDSLADLVSFGVAPGMIIYQFLRLSFAQEAQGVDVSIAWLVPAFLLPLAAAWRLARFNLDTGQSVSFKGLPVPAVGLVIASLPLIYWNVNVSFIQSLLLNKWFLYGLVAILSWLMVSTIPMMALKFNDFTLKNNLHKYLVVLVSIAAVVLFTWMSPVIIVLTYVIISLLFKNKTT